MIPIFAPYLFDQFYERRIWNSELEISPKASLGNKIAAWLIEKYSLVGRRRNFFKRVLKGKKGVVLDVGCGGGRAFYRSLGPVIGIDICVSGLVKAKKVYNIVAQADAIRLPFADGTFDYVVSSDVIGHIPVLEKDQLFKEMHRVLKPDGRMVHVIETDADNLFYNFAKKDLDLFFRYFVTEISGHFGLEKVADIRERARGLGMVEEKAEIIYDLFVPLADFLRFYGPEYQKKYWQVRCLAAIAKVLSANKFICRLTEITLGIFAHLFERFRSVNCAQDIGVVYKKT